ncbi:MULTISPECIES: dihydrofolate reductase family protein [unclassified Herbaspirillum]|uniref:dihydrofolate reductase family protein n=1 Tax=unclassified Herbaspirillum TaxID=2624150 RepID=UPI0011515CFE|nr:MULTISPECIES: dihydrofolate reductase family protein [unclassified Herbaspirillum]MBB5393867.1 dihydrofolate reductase [Herbaspirillum sp. SJZ102]TQK01279.1 dihydrofolate reductase [Herbaspirillum sp. SJZ130]TQK05673.1 dihydrofolate reductase [Herbaspirillum sp. SJZ106]TWC63208.1 dihydrofolate reductase [Herbaspirillum sp. SJZ099]
MRKLKLEMQVSIDGFTADANGDTGWMTWNWGEPWRWDEALRRHHEELTASADTLLLSRVMAEEGFYAHWQQVAEQPGDARNAFARQIVAMRKVVFTHTLPQSRWPDTVLAKGDLVEEVMHLKRQPGKDMLAYGGPAFASALAAAGLIDEFHFLVNPAVLGNGRGMLKDIGGAIPLRLVDARPFSCGVVLLHYARPE